MTTKKLAWGFVLLSIGIGIISVYIFTQLSILTLLIYFLFVYMPVTALFSIPFYRDIKKLKSNEANGFSTLRFWMFVVLLFPISTACVVLPITGTNSVGGIFTVMFLCSLPLIPIAIAHITASLILYHKGMNKLNVWSECCFAIIIILSYPPLTYIGIYLLAVF